MSNPDNLKYTTSHEWVKTEADGSITVGITQHAQELLGDIVFVESPGVGRIVKTKEECAVVESVKAAADIYAPVAGTITGFNAELSNEPEKINSDPFGAWLFKMKPDNAADVAALMDSTTYQTHVDSEAH